MTPPPAAESVDAMVADAAALVRVVAATDLPAGFSIIARPLHGPYLGMVVGSGHALAEAHGVRGGQVAVWVDPGKFTTGAPTVLQAARFTCVVLHEVAHALTNAPDAMAPGTAAGMVEATLEAGAVDLARVARQHGPRWAAAYAVLVDRALPFRRRMAEALEWYVQADLRGYGHDLAELRRVVGTTLGGELRQRLAAGTVWAQVLERALPADAARMAAVERTMADAGIGAAG